MVTPRSRHIWKQMKETTSGCWRQAEEEEEGGGKNNVYGHYFNGGRNLSEAKSASKTLGFPQFVERSVQILLPSWVKFRKDPYWFPWLAGTSKIRLFRFLILYELPRNVLLYTTQKRAWRVASDSLCPTLLLGQTRELPNQLILEGQKLSPPLYDFYNLQSLKNWVRSFVSTVHSNFIS